jgi:hypothetical protein
MAALGAWHAPIALLNREHYYTVLAEFAGTARERQNAKSMLHVYRRDRELIAA